MNFIEQIADHLEFVGIGTCATDESEGNIHWGNLPDSPDECACVFSTDTSYPGSDKGARIQITTRGKVGDWRTPYELACRITDELAEFSGFLSGDGPQARFDVVDSAHGMGLDDSGRHVYTSNYIVFYCNY